MMIIHEASFPEQGRMTIDLAILLGRECPMPIHEWAHDPEHQAWSELCEAVVTAAESPHEWGATPWSTGGEP
jgi:hypothetical protein